MKALKQGEGQQPFEYHKTALARPSNNEGMAVSKIKTKKQNSAELSGLEFPFLLFISLFVHFYFSLVFFMGNIAFVDFYD